MVQRALKDCLQTASTRSQLHNFSLLEKFLEFTLSTPWKSFKLSFLVDYRATPHATTGVSLSCILHGRQMRIELQILDVIPTTANEGAVRERVKDKQEKSKQHIDVKRNAKHQHFTLVIRFRSENHGKLRKEN